MFNLPVSLMNDKINIVVVGAGGTGGYLISMLAQMNFILNKISENKCGFNVTVYDGDEVSEFNCGRTNFYPMDIGFKKSEILVNRINYGFDTNWVGIGKNFQCDQSLGNADIIMTCVDSASFRYKLGEHYENSNTKALWFDGGNGEFDGQCIAGHLGSPMSLDKIPNVYDLYKNQLQTIEDDKSQSCSHEQSINKQSYGVNQQTALLMAQLLWQLIRKGNAQYHGAFFDLNIGDVSPLSPNKEIWESFGYTS